VHYICIGNRKEEHQNEREKITYSLCRSKRSAGALETVCRRPELDQRSFEIDTDWLYHQNISLENDEETEEELSALVDAYLLGTTATRQGLPERHTTSLEGSQQRHGVISQLLSSVLSLREDERTIPHSKIPRRHLRRPRPARMV
jgi:hypothetical protein